MHSFKPRFGLLFLLLKLPGILPFCLWAAAPLAVPLGATSHEERPGQTQEQSDDHPSEALARKFKDEVQPFLRDQCLVCHGPDRQEGKLDLRPILALDRFVPRFSLWKEVVRRVRDHEMPPSEAANQPSDPARRQLVSWFQLATDEQAERHAGDPGIVLARRLNQSEYDNVIRDLTGVEIRPAGEFPIDPASEAGFDNTGESLVMTPALLEKYLVAARHVARHLVFYPRGLRFAPHSMVTDTDRDKYCVQRIVEFYGKHEVDLAHYFVAAWRFTHRERLGINADTLAAQAMRDAISARYLEQIWRLLRSDSLPDGPVRALQAAWQELPVPTDADETTPVAECKKLAELARELRKQLRSPVRKLTVHGISDGSQPLVLWRNRQLAASHRRYDGTVATDAVKLEAACREHWPSAARYCVLDDPDGVDAERYRRSCQTFCETIPDTFVVVDRGPYFDPNAANQGRLLTAGFHLMQGYFRDDQPLMELVLSDHERESLDQLWRELDFITQVPSRQYKDFVFFERAEPPRFMLDAEFDFARSEDHDLASPDKIVRLRQLYLAKARRHEASDEALQAIEQYFEQMDRAIRRLEAEAAAAEQRQIVDLLELVERAFRRPLVDAERDEFRRIYHEFRDADGASHEEAIRETLASALMSPHFCYRYLRNASADDANARVRELTGVELANRLSFFLWSSMPDQELMQWAQSDPPLREQPLLELVRRLVRSEKIGGFAQEFAGNWLGFRRFQQHQAVDRERFPQFTNELREAMFEEPVRFFVDLLRNNRPANQLLRADFTWVNGALASHYGIPFPEENPEHWVRVSERDASAPTGRGGLLSMGAFLTMNAPGLRTSPVKRGYWVVRRLLGEQIPAPPPNVPELPKDEAALGDDAEVTLPMLMARHRADPQCSSCHHKFDFAGLAFEGFGPIGERRDRDLGGRPVEDHFALPDGSTAKGVDGLRQYLLTERADEFHRNLAEKLVTYALGRPLVPPDTQLLSRVRKQLAAEDQGLLDVIETIVLSSQFRTTRVENGGAK